MIKTTPFEMVFIIRDEMKTCVIFCAAEFDKPAQPIGQEDLVIAADGGLKHTEKLDIAPDVVLGDFDSLGYVPDSAAVFPVEKDDTDSMLAVKLGLERGFKRFVVYGGMDGERLDHTVANLQMLQYLADRGAEAYLVGRQYIATALRNGSFAFDAQAEGIISVFCIGADALGVNIEGLKYSLTDGTLSCGYPLGVSNHFAGQKARISVKEGCLLILWDRNNGFPER